MIGIVVAWNVGIILKLRESGKKGDIFRLLNGGHLVKGIILGTVVLCTN